MPKNRRQHFVPQFYLRRYSKDGKSINIWNLRRQLKIVNANLKNQCYGVYFYGKIPIVEQTLSSVEGNAAQVLRSIGDTSRPPLPGSPEHQLLVLYILMQHARTLHMADELNAMTDNLAKHLVRGTKEFDGIDLSKFRVGLEEPARDALSIATSCYPLLFDLAYKVIVNRTDTEFVTSDNPVVFYNQFLSFRKDGSNTGFATKGLQIFLPVDPSHIILLYDGNVYQVGNNKNNVVYVDHRREVDQLNMLQICSASDNIYFRDEALDAKNLHKMAENFRTENKSDFQVVQIDRSVEGEHRELVRSSKVDVNTNLSLRFMNIRFSAKRWRIAFRKSNVQPVAIIRNERLLDAFERFETEVKKGKYTQGQFFEFLGDQA